MGLSEIHSPDRRADSMTRSDSIAAREPTGNSPRLKGFAGRFGPAAGNSADQRFGRGFRVEAGADDLDVIAATGVEGRMDQGVDDRLGSVR